MTPSLTLSGLPGSPAFPSWSEHVIGNYSCAPPRNLQNIMECASITAAPHYPRHMTTARTPSSAAGKCAVAFAEHARPAAHTGSFAFARIRGDISLVQVVSLCQTSPSSSVSSLSSLPSPSPPPSCSSSVSHSTIVLKVFRHEFITIFRLSHALTVNSEDVRILECLADSALRYEEEQETVFLARDLVAQLNRMSTARYASKQTRYPYASVRR
ncbi:hypothetical protein HGRIS_000171 [Hohenbuehelia grisea]|uniref:Uncharacterized protein n=1 Tax=Hohenbuehelia grisea TaxID=104357 RepID=A0ABR3JR18_9AGAR